MDNALGYALAVEGRHLFEQLIILHEQWTARTGGQRVLVIADGIAMRRGQLFPLFHVSLLLGLDRIGLRVVNLLPIGIPTDNRIPRVIGRRNPDAELQEIRYKLWAPLFGM